MIRLDFGIYKGSTLLHNWWSVVKSHFTTLADAHNALEAEVRQSVSELSGTDTALEEKMKRALETEEAQRKIEDSKLSASISAEKSARESASAIIQRSIDEKDARIYDAIKEEAEARLSGDEVIKSDVRKLSGASHRHDNLDLLGAISAEDVSVMRERTEAAEHNALMLEYLTELCRGFSSCVSELYELSGINLYDGGVYGEAVSGDTLDGGRFTDTSLDEFDCGAFDKDIFASVILDGGTF